MLSKMPPKKQEVQIVQASGKVVFANGDVYNGEYILENGVKFRQGKGIYVCFCEESLNDLALTDEQRKCAVPLHNPDDIVHFDGEWVKDVFYEGTIRFASGASYFGKFDGTKYVSGGTYVFPDGVTYVGEFRDGYIHGKGSVNGGALSVYRNGFGPGLDAHV